jgi:putative membrane protein
MATAAGLVLAPMSVGAQTSKTDTAGAKLATTEQKFVKEVASGGAAEVELGKLAEERASNDAVKQFGQRMVTDHGKAGDELGQLAQQKGVSVSKEPSAKHKALRDRLAKLSGADFDRAYVSEMLKDHRKDVSEFRKQAQSAKDPDLKAWAAKTLPTLEEHLKMVQDLSTQVKKAPKTTSKTQ